MQPVFDSPSRGALSALTGVIARHPWRAIGVWVLVIAAIIVGFQTLGGALQDNFSIPDSDAQRAGGLLEERFPARAGNSATIVFRAEDGLGAADAKAAIAAALRSAAGTAHIVATGDPFTGKSGQISEDGIVAYADVQFD
jgi:RND superfamily putative drug exporter